MTRPSGKGTNEEEVAKDRGLNEKIEETLSLVKEIAGKSADQRNKESSEVTKEEVLRAEDGRK